MGHCSFPDAGMQYSLIGNVVALVVRGVCSTFGAVYPAPSKSTDDAATALKSFVGDSKVTMFYLGNADVVGRLEEPESSPRGFATKNAAHERYT